MITEAYMLQLIRDRNMDVLKIKDSRQKSWVEIRGKKGMKLTVMIRKINSTAF